MPRSPLIDIHGLQERILADDVLLIDASNYANAYQGYLQAHLPGALFVDLEKQLSKPSGDPAEGGRHPLPSAQVFANTLGALGISPDTPIVVYDHHHGTNAAARLWRMLRALGHEHVQVLDGGIAAVQRAGMALHTGEETARPSCHYPFREWILPIASLAEVQQASRDDQQLIIDVRSAERYQGLTEPIDKVAGHIPSAINIPLHSNLDANGHFIARAHIRKKYLAAIAQREPSAVIVHCGSGVTACHTLLAFDYAGLEIPKLYVGSWSEWSQNNVPISTGVT